VVDLDYLVAGLDAGLVRGGVLDRRHHGQQVILDGDFQTQATETAAGFDLEVAIEIGREIGAVRVERREHPGDCAVNKLLGGDRLDVVLLHDGQHVGERGQLFVGVVGQRVGAAHGDLRQQDKDRYCAYAGDQKG